MSDQGGYINQDEREILEKELERSSEVDTAVKSLIEEKNKVAGSLESKYPERKYFVGATEGEKIEVRIEPDESVSLLMTIKDPNENSPASPSIISLKIFERLMETEAHLDYQSESRKGGVTFHLKPDGKIVKMGTIGSGLNTNDFLSFTARLSEALSTFGKYPTTFDKFEVNYKAPPIEHHHNSKHSLN